MDQSVAAVGASLFAALSYDVLRIYARAWSEGLFLVLVLFGMFYLGRYLERPSWYALIVSAGLFALAWLSRYAGATLLITGGLAILLWSSRAFWRRIRDAVLFGAIVTLPMALLMLRNYLLTDNIANRTLVFTPMPSAWWQSAYISIAGWLVPVSAAEPIRFASVAIIITLCLTSLVVCRSRATDTETACEEPPCDWVVPATMLLFSLLYIMFIVVATLIADSAIPASSRIWSPVFSALVVVSAYAVYRFPQRMPEHRYVLSARGLLLLGLLVVFSSRAA